MSSEKREALQWKADAESEGLHAYHLRDFACSVAVLHLLVKQ